MSGVAVIRSLLAANSNVIAVVPAARIISGDLPLNTAMPAIGITKVSGVPYRMIDVNAGAKMRIDRVQVTVFRKAPPADVGYPGLDSLLALVLPACANQRGTVGGISVDSIAPDIEGPDLPIPEMAIFTRSMDFIVHHITAAPVPSNALLGEDGQPVLTEDGNYILTE